jgi:hypothetical protein
MKLEQLKIKAYEAWDDWHQIQAVIPDADTFQSEARTYGDLRLKATWESAFSDLLARCWTEYVRMVLIVEDAEIIQYYLLDYFRDAEWRYLRPQVVARLIEVPQVCEKIGSGLAEYIRQHPTTTEKQDLEEIWQIARPKLEKLHAQRKQRRAA